MFLLRFYWMHYRENFRYCIKYSPIFFIIMTLKYGILSLTAGTRDGQIWHVHQWPLGSPPCSSWPLRSGWENNHHSCQGQSQTKVITENGGRLEKGKIQCWNCFSYVDRVLNFPISVLHNLYIRDVLLFESIIKVEATQILLPGMLI